MMELELIWDWGGSLYSKRAAPNKERGCLKDKSILISSTRSCILDNGAAVQKLQSIVKRQEEGKYGLPRMACLD